MFHDVCVHNSVLDTFDYVTYVRFDSHTRAYLGYENPHLLRSVLHNMCQASERETKLQNGRIVTESFAIVIGDTSFL